MSKFLSVCVRDYAVYCLCIYLGWKKTNTIAAAVFASKDGKKNERCMYSMYTVPF